MDAKARWFAKQHRHFAILLRVVAISILIGGTIGWAYGTTSLHVDITIGALVGLFIGGSCTSLELFVLSNQSLRLSRRVPVLLLTLFRGGGFTLIILLGLIVPEFLRTGTPPKFDALFGEIFLVCSAVSFAISLAIEITRLLGTEATLAVMTSRYHLPRLEDRVILIADVVGSTAIGETLDDLQFHRLMSEIAQDLAGPIAAARGDVHRYVGDAVIVTWPLALGVGKARCLEAARGMHAAMAHGAERYQKMFGIIPHVRIAVHAGRVAAGEIGDWKKEIALLGDTMNTTSRLEGAARDVQVDTVLSESVVRHFDDSTRQQLLPLPAFQAAGKSEALAIWADPQTRKAAL